MDIYKKASDKLRIALIYVLNDVVQKAANKRDTNVTSALHPHWINATGLSNVSVKKPISRCVEVLEQRNVYPPHIIEEMKAALVSRIATEKDETQSGDLDFSQMTRGIDSFFKNEAREILARSSFNFKESVQSRVKDRDEGVKALADMDTSRQKMLRDVTVVNDAYEKFAEGIRETKQQLETMEKSGALVSDASSPPRDAPSPTAGDDPFLHGVDGDEATGAEDMEMDEEDAPGPSSCFLKPSKDYVASIPAVPEIDPRLQRLVSQSVMSTNQFPHNGNMPMPANMNRTMLDPRQLDPRQARFFPPPQPPPQLPQQLNFPPPIIPPPGISPPPPAAQNPTVDSMLAMDKTQPPPQIFSMPPPQISNGIIPNESASTSHAGGTALSPPVALFNPSNPPPSLMASQMQISPSSSHQMNFSIPPPSLVQPPLPLNQFRTPPLYHGGQKRRNSSGSESAGNFKQTRPSWSFSTGEEAPQNLLWGSEDSDGRGANWRRSVGESGRDLAVDSQPLRKPSLIIVDFHHFAI
uniref:CID domain-containing protein n=1 Tax=Globodera rostochiensis TaxID=31243 RepID=A0A914GRF9_GLORO